MEQDIPPPPPHVLIFPIPALGHVNSMLKLAELLSVAGLRITFLNSEYNHDRLTRHADVCSRYTHRFPGFQFKTITDGLPMDHPRVGHKFDEVLHSVKSVTPPLLKQMLIDDIKPPVDCIISDGFMSFAVDVANELGIPIIYFRTISACAFWAYFCVRDIIDAGELPIKGKDDMDRLIKNVPGMETFLRCRDLPSFCRAEDPLDRNIQLFMSETRSSPRAQGLILNTFDDLEGPILSQIRTHCPNIYTIGPLQAHLKTRVPSGLDMKDHAYDRKVVEKTVNDLMVEKREEFVESTDRMSKLAWKSVSDGGSSSCNLDLLIEDIRSISVRAST
ncbi:hypothetical protein Q3G72_007711 [Acer saccharum]|nr:hypothetical protein Q3G72_007711 [Acer saccharum]